MIIKKRLAIFCLRPLVVAVLSLFFVSCEGARFGAREKGALTGGALGAGLGAIVGHETGHTGAGIAIGSAAGVLGGALVGNEIDRADEAQARTDERLRQNDDVIRENRRLVEELRRHGADARSTDRGVVVNLPDVLFEFDKARLTSDAKRVVGDIASVLRSVESRRVAVEGHTDSVGTISYNQRLSEDRARSVAGELVSKGISRRRLYTRGFGESDPISSNRTAEGRARNRRVEIIVENF